MSKSIETKILIQAHPEKVWSILTQFENYPLWNPFIKSLVGKVEVGNTIKVRLEPPNANGMTFKPKVLVFEPNKEFRWLGHFLIKGLFDGEHIFQLKNNKDGTTTFIHSENFKGILVPMFKKMIDKNVLKGFQMMNEQIKLLAE